MLYLRTMGALSLHEDGPDGPVLIENSKYLVMLAWLTAAPGRRASRDYLSSLLWPTSERKARLSSLRQCLYSLGKAGAGACLEVTDESVSLCSNGLGTDIDDFRTALEQRDYEAAIALARGHFLEGSRNGIGHELHQWVDAENERIRIGLSLAYTEAVRQHLTHEDPRQAVDLAREYVRREPLGEHPQVLLVQALRAAGNDAAALAAYEAYRSLLQDAVGDRPGAELEASAARVREELLRTPSYPIPDLHSPPPPPASMPRRSLGPGWIALSAAAVVAALALGWAARSTFWRPADSWISGLSASLPVGIASDSVFWLEVKNGRARRGPLTTPPERVAEESIPSPDGRYVAEASEVPSGYDLSLLDRQTGESRSLVATPADEKPLDWSPDGRYLAFGFGLGLGGDGSYWHGVGVYDIVADSIVYLRESGKTSGRTVARWSPDGTRIAYQAGPDSALDIMVMDADGTRRHTATQGGHVLGWPVWSPDSRRLMFAYEEAGQRQLYSVHSDGTGMNRVTDLSDAWNAFAWVSPTAALFTRGSQAAARPWAVNPVSGAVRPLGPPDGPAYTVLYRYWPRFDQPPWIHHVRISTPGSEMVVGERVGLELKGWTASGAPLPVDRLTVRWSVSDSAVARLDGDMLEAVATGTLQLIGSAGGWRADTLVLRVAGVVTPAIDPVFDEDWSAGLDTSTWIPVGEPFPYAVSAGGPESAGVFVNNGDKNFLSAAFTRRAFSLADGVTLEVWGRMPFDGGHWQSFVVRLLDAADSRRLQATLDPWSTDALETYAVSMNFNGYGRISELSGRDRDGVGTRGKGRNVVNLPWPEPTDEWRLYTLQVEPDGTTSLRYGDRLAAREPAFVHIEPADSVLVAIGGNSWNTRVEHGRLRVYEGLRYRLR